MIFRLLDRALEVGRVLVRQRSHRSNLSRQMAQHAEIRELYKIVLSLIDIFEQFHQQTVLTAVRSGNNRMNCKRNDSSSLVKLSIVCWSNLRWLSKIQIENERRTIRSPFFRKFATKRSTTAIPLRSTTYRTNEMSFSSSNNKQQHVYPNNAYIDTETNERIAWPVKSRTTNDFLFDIEKNSRCWRDVKSWCPQPSTTDGPEIVESTAHAHAAKHTIERWRSPNRG